MTARSVPSCAFGLTAIVLLNVCVGPFTGLIPAFARSIFHGGTAMAGAFSCLQGLGAIVGAMAVTALAPRYGRTRLIAILVASMAVSYLGYGLSPRPWIAGVFVMFVGASVASLFTTMTFIIQRDAPAAHRGRVMATMQGTIGFSFGVGIVILGAIGDLANLRVAFAGAAILFATLALLLNQRLPQWRTLVDHPQVALAGTAAIRPN